MYVTGDVFGVGRCTDAYSVDAGMYDVSEYGSVYLTDTEHPAIVETGVGTTHKNILDMLKEVDVAARNLASRRSCVHAESIAP